MTAPTLQSILGRSGTPALCLEYLNFGRNVFAPDDDNWFKPSNLLGIYDQAQQLVNSDTVLLPLLDLIKNWWGQSKPPADKLANRPGKAMKMVFSDNDLVEYITEVVNSLSSVARDSAAYGLLIDSPECWYQWFGVDIENEMEEEDVEDCAFYLANFLGRLSDTSLTGLIIHMNIAVDGDISDAFEPLTNVCTHQGWTAAIYGTGIVDETKGFSFYSSATLTTEMWLSSAAIETNNGFITAVIPAETTAENVLKALKHFRT